LFEEVNADETKLMLTSREQNSGQNCNMKIDVQFFENCGTVQVFGNSLKKSKLYTIRNRQHIEIRECLLSFGAECFVLQFAVQNCNEWYIKNCNFVIYILCTTGMSQLKILISPSVTYGCGIWYLILREESRLGVLEDRAPKKVFGRKRGEVTGN
jgi:hypothetical protein